MRDAELALYMIAKRLESVSMRGLVSRRPELTYQIPLHCSLMTDGGSVYMQSVWEMRLLTGYPAKLLVFEARRIRGCELWGRKVWQAECNLRL